jgi:RNA polymerase sigma-70 factor, ECF subfamily
MGTLSVADETSCKSNSTAEIKAHATELDAQLMCRVRDGDIYAFGLLVERNRKPLISFLQRIVQNRFEAEELAQEVFLRVYRARASYEPAAKFTTWLFRIASRTAINQLRDGRHERFQGSLEGRTGEPNRHYPDGKPTIEEALLAGAKAQEVRDAINRLPPTQRAAVVMHKYRELEYPQIALQLECSESAVKSLLFRAYEHLRASLAHFAHATPESSAYEG